MKQTIRLNESELHRIIKESVKRTLNEQSGEADVINAMEEANELLRSVYPTLVEINRDGQFDYVTSGKLGDVCSNLADIMGKIEKIVWQN